MRTLPSALFPWFVSLALAQAPTANVYVTVSAPRSSSFEAAAGGDTVRLAQGVPVLAAAAYDRSDAEDGSKAFVDVVDQDLGQPAGQLSQE